MQEAAVIRTGNELENLLWNATPYQAGLLEILGSGLYSPDQTVFVTSSRQIEAYDKTLPRTDILIRDIRRGVIEVVELKDGDTFDTKKSSGELASAVRMTEWLQSRVGLPVRFYFCSFNQADKLTIVRGVKNTFTIQQVMTGQELCERIGVDYTNIRLLRREHQIENREYFIQQLLAIPDIRKLAAQYLTAADE